MKKVKPNEYFSNCIMEVARVRKEVYTKNNMTSTQHNEYMEYLKNQFDEKFAEICQQEAKRKAI